MPALENADASLAAHSPPLSIFKPSLLLLLPGDPASSLLLYNAMVEILDWRVCGTRYGIRLDPDGLIAAGEQGVQLTWMDAKVGDYVVTPRCGKPVEIQALWYNALCIMEDLVTRFSDKDRANYYAEMASRTKKSFNRLFWNEHDSCLYDVIDGDERDGSMRPNQIFAVSLPNTMLSRRKAQAVVLAVERHLLTPFGLRSLAPSDPKYRGRYEGGVESCDGAYHQGTVWAWLMGPFITAYVRANGRSTESQETDVRASRPCD